MSSQAETVRNYFMSRLPARDRHALPVKLHGRRIYVFPTRQGFIFFAMLGTLLFGSVNHNNNLGFIMTFLLGSMALVSIFHTYLNVSGLTLISARAKPVFAGQQAVFEISAKSPGFSRQALSFYFPGGKRAVLNFRQNSRLTVEVSHNTEKRGLLKPGILYISTTYPLGLFRSWSTLLIDTSCLVYPKPVPGPIISEPGQQNEDNEGETGGAGVEDFSGLETYQRGDPLQHISWKTFSRGQGLYTKKFEGQQGKTIYFNPDTLAGMNLEMKLSRLCYMILKAEAIQIPYGLKLGSHVIPPGVGGPHKRQCLRELALAGRNE